MLYHAKSETVTVGNAVMDYVSFGKGNKNLIIIPGLGDALKTVKSAAIPLALMYKIFAENYKVYIFSRKNELEQEASTKDMADDQAAAMKKLKLSKAYVMGISQGGMIAQYLAINHPELVEKLVLAVTLCRQNEVVQNVVHNWIKLANANDFEGIFADTAEKTYSEKRLKAYRPFYRALSRLSKPKSLERFLIQANACVRHNAGNEIEKIQCPTLVIGGDEDKIVGKDAAAEIAQGIPNSVLKLYSGLGHGTYEEASDFNNEVLAFFDA